MRTLHVFLVSVILVLTVASCGAFSNCDPSYEGACIPPLPPDLNCDDIEERNFQVVGPDHHQLDGDGDGRACE